MEEMPEGYTQDPNYPKIQYWLPAEIVLEIKAADLQLSPVHTCGGSDLENLGIPLLFFCWFERIKLSPKKQNPPFRCTPSAESVIFF